MPHTPSVHNEAARPDEVSGEDLARLIAGACAGQQDSWRGLINLYSRRVFALAKSRLRRPDLAEEVTQSVFVTVASKLGVDAASGGGYSEQGKFEAWLFRVAVNRIRDEARKLKRHATPTDPEILAGLAGATGQAGNGGGGQSVQLQQELTALRGAMEQLSEADREIIELRHHAGMSFAQIAQMLGEPLGTLLARHHRALRKLKDELKPTKADDSPSDE